MFSPWFKCPQSWYVYWVLKARFWEGEEGLQDFSEKLLEASLMSNTANVSQLQDSPATAQGQAQQRQW